TGRDLGFSRNIATAEVAMTSPPYTSDSTLRLAAWDRLGAAYLTIPGVERAGVATVTPLSMGQAGFIDIAGRPSGNDGAGYRLVSEGYLQALGVRLLRGRSFGTQDAAGA